MVCGSALSDGERESGGATRAASELGAEFMVGERSLRFPRKTAEGSASGAWLLC